MFDLADRPRVWIPVSWPGLMPGPDESVAISVEHIIELEVEIVDREELAGLFPAEDDVAAFMRLVSGWRKFKLSGKEAPFTPEIVAKLLKVPMFSDGFELAYIKAWQGKGETREKNSDGSLSNGRAGDRQLATIPSSSEIADNSE